ncbi:tetratricopeptide repeat protein [Anaerolineales bacterium HSG25]|nr:tetratricopeptide repeat protein [Anaerolineales bacterium HSG25]
MTKFLEISLLGGLTIKKDGQPITEFTYRKEQALFVYLAYTGQPYSRETLAELMWHDRTPKQSQSNLRNLLTKLRRLFNPYLTITRQLVSFNTDCHHRLDVTEFQNQIDQTRVQLSQGGQLTRSVANRLGQALNLYRGEFLAGFYIRKSPNFENWVIFERERLHKQAMTGLHQLTEFYLQRQQYEDGLTYTRRLLALDPLDEVAQTHSMQLLAYMGQRETALAQFQNYCRLLDEELGVEPSSQLSELYQQVRDGDMVAQSPLTKTSSTGSIIGIQSTPHPASKLPQPLTSFVGRQRELSRIIDCLANPDNRLLTLVGAGGMGKTRLALQAAHRQQPEFSDGVYFIPLAEIDKEELIIIALAEQLGLSSVPEIERRLQLFKYLENREMLLVFDNFEHIIEEASPLIFDLLQSTTELKILVTSREALNFQAEWLLRVEGLPYPTVDDVGLAVVEPSHPDPHKSLLTAAKEYGAIQLFMDRASRLMAEFPLSVDVLRLCQLLEGMPLAIELAAALVDQLSCAEIIDLIHTDLDVLETSLRDFPDRHRRLWSVFEQSWQRLTETEQSVWAQCAVFRGGYTRQAAKQILDLPASRSKAKRKSKSARHIQSILATLTRKSLLRRSPDGRYEMHELLRQFAKEQWSEIDETGALLDRVTARHSQFYLNLVEQQEQALIGKSPQTALAHIQHELDNVRKAWKSACQQTEFELLKRTSKGLAQFYALTGLFNEGVEMFTLGMDALHRSFSGLNRVKLAESRPPSVPPKGGEAYDFRIGIEQGEPTSPPLGIEGYDLRVGIEQGELASPPLGGIEGGHGGYSNEQLLIQGTLLVAQAHLFSRQAMHEQAISAATEVVALAQKMDTVELEARGCWEWGWALQSQGSYGLAQTKFERALAVSVAHELPYLQANSMMGLGTIALRQNDYGTAKERYQQALQAYQKLGHIQGQGQLLNNMGTLAMYQNDYNEATICYHQALKIYRNIGDQWGIARTLGNLGALVNNQNDYILAQKHYEQALHIFYRIGDWEGQANVLGNLGISADYLGSYEAAKRYTSQALQIQHDISFQYQEAVALANMSLHEHHLENHQAAYNYAERALLIGNQIEVPVIQGYAFLFQGHALSELEQFEASNTAYQQALQIWETLQADHLVAETLAGLARLLLFQGNIAEALSHVETILANLDTSQLQGAQLEGAEEPLRIYLTCYEVLQANEDKRAKQILNVAYQLLQEKVGNINDEALRDSFLKNVVVNRRLAQAWQARSAVG